MILIILALTSIGCLIYSSVQMHKYNHRLKRNDKVYDFRSKLLSKTGIFDKLYEEKQKIWNKYSYEDMLNSKKPLTLEEWFTPEEINILNNKEKKRFKNILNEKR